VECRSSGGHRLAVEHVACLEYARRLDVRLGVYWFGAGQVIEVSGSVFTYLSSEPPWGERRPGHFAV